MVTEMINFSSWCLHQVCDITLSDWALLRFQVSYSLLQVEQNLALHLYLFLKLQKPRGPEAERRRVTFCQPSRVHTLLLFTCCFILTDGSRVCIGSQGSPGQCGPSCCSSLVHSSVTHLQIGQQRCLSLQQQDQRR